MEEEKRAAREAEKRKRAKEEKEKRKRYEIAYEKYLEQYPLKRREEEIVKKQEGSYWSKGTLYFFIITALLSFAMGVLFFFFGTDVEAALILFIMLCAPLSLFCFMCFCSLLRKNRRLDKAKKEYQELQKIPPFKEKDYE